MTGRDWIIAATMVALAVSILVRVTRRDHTSRPLLVCQGIVALTICLSISPVFPAVDGLVGSASVLNLGQNLLLAWAYWIYTTIVAIPLLPQGAKRTWDLGLWIPVVSMAGTTICFWLISPDASSRGLEAFRDDPWWGCYWVFALMCLWLPAPRMVALMLRVINIPRLGSLRFVYGSMIVGYASAFLAVIAYLGTAVSSWFYAPREWLVLLTQLGLVLALIVGATGGRRQAKGRARGGAVILK